jgi:hypothetical protein
MDWGDALALAAWALAIGAACALLVADERRQRPLAPAPVVPLLDSLPAPEPPLSFEDFRLAEIARYRLAAPRLACTCEQAAI